MIDFLRHCGVATGVCKKVFHDPDSLIKDEVEIEKDLVLRKKLREGIILEDFDRRQNSEPYYSAPERRAGIERRNGFATIASQPGRRL
jgi:hypothetical protein